MKEVLHEQDSREVVEIALVDGEMRMSGAPNRPGHVFVGDRLFERHDVHPRGHDLTSRHIPKSRESALDLELELGAGPRLLWLGGPPAPEHECLLSSRNRGRLSQLESSEGSGSGL